MNRTVLRLSTQALFGRRRGVVLLLLAGALLGLAVLVRLLTDDEDGIEAVVGLGFTLALPLVALLAATARPACEVSSTRDATATGSAPNTIVATQAAMNLLTAME